MPVANISALTQWLTALSLFVAIIGAIGAFFWRMGRTLSVLLELPSQVREILHELRDVNRTMNRVKDESAELRKESQGWHQRHLQQEHRRRPDR